MLCAGLILCTGNLFAVTLEEGWQNPPKEARLRAYWWWLNGNVTRASIQHDLEEMKAKGFAGAVLMDANGADQSGNGKVAHGPVFFSAEWRDLYKFTLSEADRLGLEISLNIQSGWNLGGPVVTPEDAAKKYVWSETTVTGSNALLSIKLDRPNAKDDFYRDTAFIAFRLKEGNHHPPLKNWKKKALQESLQPFSAPNSSPLFEESASVANEQDGNTEEIVDLSSKTESDGSLKWMVPDGDWQIIRFGYTIGDHAAVSTCSEGWQGYALDVYSAEAFQHYWDKIVEPLILDAGSLAGKSLKYLHTDSWEIELANWTPDFPAEFKQRCGYDLIPWLPVLTGRIVNSREESDRFLFDYRKTLGDLAIDHHYRLFRDGAHRHGLMIHPESGGPHAVPIDAQRCLGWDDAPMSEFWAWSWTHRIGDANRFFVKQPASAAHTYGHKLVFAEGFTTIGPNWQETIWDNLKPSFDKALCEGLNVLVWHAFVCSPEETGLPGQQYFAGTHLNPKVTWWSKSGPFFNYINRCQWMLQQGHFAADVLYYYGDHVPNFAQLKSSDPVHIQPGYDYDVITEEALIERTGVTNGRIVLPDGMNYRLLVIPQRDRISLPVLRKLRSLVSAGATVVGPKPNHGERLDDFKTTETEVTAIADELWSGQLSNGRVIARHTAREVLEQDGIKPDCEFLPVDSHPSTGLFDYIHRTDGGTEIYFVANRTNFPASARVAFRVSEKEPELWNPVTGDHSPALAYEENDGRTFLKLDFEKCGSRFIVFRNQKHRHIHALTSNQPKFTAIKEISGPWTVHFDPKSGGPASAVFENLQSWTTRPESGIKYYSGTATYENQLTISKTEMGGHKSKVFLDLGELRELGEVRVNGKSCGILWCPPWRVEITDALKSGENTLSIDIVNFWPNRIIGDASLPEKDRFTRTNIRNLTSKTPLMDSGLFGPVKLMRSPD